MKAHCTIYGHVFGNTCAAKPLVLSGHWLSRHTHTHTHLLVADGPAGSYAKLRTKCTNAVANVNSERNIHTHSTRPIWRICATRHDVTVRRINGTRTENVTFAEQLLRVCVGVFHSELSCRSLAVFANLCGCGGWIQFDVEYTKLRRRRTENTLWLSSVFLSVQFVCTVLKLNIM